MDEIINTSERVIEAEYTITDVVNSGIVNSGVTAPSAVKPRKVLKTIHDKYVGDFDIYECSHAWWLDTTKVEQLIIAFKAGHTVENAWRFAGISRRQWEYFNEIHPEFCVIKEACEEYLIFKAQNTVGGLLDTDGRLAMKFLELRDKRYAKNLKVEGDQPLGQTVNVQINQNVDTTKIENILTRAAERFLVDGGGTSSDVEVGG